MFLTILHLGLVCLTTLIWPSLRHKRNACWHHRRRSVHTSSPSCKYSLKHTKSVLFSFDSKWDIWGSCTGRIWNKDKILKSYLCYSTTLMWPDQAESHVCDKMAQGTKERRICGRSGTHVTSLQSGSETQPFPHAVVIWHEAASRCAWPCYGLIYFKQTFL